MTIDNIINQFEKPTDLEIQKNSEKNQRNRGLQKIKTCTTTFFGSRWMGLVIGPAYGIFLYLYVTHLILGGAPFTSKFKSANQTTNQSILTTDLKNLMNVKDESFENDADFEPLMSHQTSHLIGLGIGGGTGIGITIYSLFSVEVRCSMVLMVPSLLTKRGRGFMLTFVTSCL